MKRSSVILFALAAASVTGFIACQGGSAKQQADVVISKDSLIKRGSYLVTAGGCDDCHSPKRLTQKGIEFIPELRLSGYKHDKVLPSPEKSQLQKGWILFNDDGTATVGPWGASFSANLTSDASGIGNWSEEQFRKALREGKSKGLDGARPLLPPMPWQNIGQLSDLDIKAIFTFLQSTRPVENIVPAPKSLSEL